MRRLKFKNVQIVGSGFKVASHLGQQRGPFYAQSNLGILVYISLWVELRIEQLHSGVPMEPWFPDDFGYYRCLRLAL